MAISNLDPLTYEQFRALNITPFPIPPTKTQTGNPDPNAQITLAGWVGTDLIAFTVVNSGNTRSGLAIDTSNPNTIDLNVTSSVSPTATSSYFTVNMGSNAINNNWDLSFDVASNKTTSGAWKFVKGKSGFDIPKK
jgi:hypothetical protein